MAVSEKAATATNGTDAPAVKRTRNVVKLPVAAPVLNPATNLLELRMATSDKAGFSLNLPSPLDEAIKADSTARKANPNAVVRDILAAHYGMSILDNYSTRTTAYSGLSKEEAAAQRAADKSKKSQNVAAVLSAIKAGKITPEIAAALGISL